MTTTMTHDAFADRLMAYLEDEMDDPTRAAMDRHARECAECGALLADLRDLRVEARALPELTPSRDLWDGIAARIEAPVVPIALALPASPSEVVEASPVAAPVALRSRRWMRASLIAASLVGAVSIGYLSGTTRTTASADSLATGLDFAMSPEGVPADSLAGFQAGAPVMVPAQLAVATLAADYDREIVRLRRLVDERRNQLDPTTVSIIEKNLRVIDAAIAESKQAIARDPASRFLIESLNQSLESKVELLRIAAGLPSRI